MKTSDQPRAGVAAKTSRRKSIQAVFNEEAIQAMVS
jgi:hypothetical protein